MRHGIRWPTLKRMRQIQELEGIFKVQVLHHALSKGNGSATSAEACSCNLFCDLLLRLHSGADNSMQAGALWKTVLGLQIGQAHAAMLLS